MLKHTQKHLKRCSCLIAALLFAVFTTAPSALAAGNYTWTNATTGTTASGKNLETIASSASGQYLAAGIFAGDIFTSSDYGAHWTDQTLAGSRSWIGITSSASGQYVAAINEGGDIYTSSDYGVHWTDQTLAGSRGWIGIASSSNGQYLTAAVNGGDIYTSSDYGVHWTDQTLAGSLGWYSIASSSSGQYLTAAVDGGDIYTSSDYGVHWTNETTGTSLSGLGWDSIASSSTGQHLAATAWGGDVYVGNDPALAPPKPGITNQSIAVTVNGSVTVDVLSGVSGDPDSSTLSIVSGPSHGQAVDPPGTITYTPNAGYSGSDSLVYQVCSSLDNTVCSQATLSFTVAAANAVKAPATGYGRPSQVSAAVSVLAALSLMFTGSGLMLLNRQKRTTISR